MKITEEAEVKDTMILGITSPKSNIFYTNTLWSVLSHLYQQAMWEAVLKLSYIVCLLSLYHSLICFTCER